ncbi:MAG: SGNH/GDSL hydrolase family protein [Vicinamibacteria bacterium]
MKQRVPLPGLLSFVLLLPACGGSGISGPSGNPTPRPTPVVITRSVTFVAFLDENGNKVLDGNEVTRIPNAEIVAGGVKGQTAALTGQVILQVPEGTQTLDVTAASLPPFYRPPATSSISVPSSTTIMVPITLPLGSSNRPDVYMAFGDSITNGEPDIGDGNGYRLILQSMLRAHFGSGTVVDEGIDGTNSDKGADRLGGRLSRVHPAFTLIFYGVNDWNDQRCDSLEDVPCFTTDSLRSMVQQVNHDGGHALLATLTPVNVGYDDRVPETRQEWVTKQNIYVRQVADQEGAVLVDLNAAFIKSGLVGDALFRDHIHPQEVGYQIMAQTWFDAITKPYSKILSEF